MRLDVLPFGIGQISGVSPHLRERTSSLRLIRLYQTVSLETVWKIARRLWSVCIRDTQGGELASLGPGFEHSWESRMELILIFQTVSLSNWVNKGQRSSTLPTRRCRSPRRPR